MMPGFVAKDDTRNVWLLNRMLNQGLQPDDPLDWISLGEFGSRGLAFRTGDELTPRRKKHGLESFCDVGQE